MAYKAVVTQGFDDDLDGSLGYIAYELKNPVAASRLLLLVQDEIDAISENPFMHPVYHDEKIAKRGIRYVPIRNYMIFYRANEESKTVYFLRFLYGGQNVTDIL